MKRQTKEKYITLVQTYNDLLPVRLGPLSLNYGYSILEVFRTHNRANTLNFCVEETGGVPNISLLLTEIEVNFCVRKKPSVLEESIQFTSASLALKALNSFLI